MNPTTNSANPGEGELPQPKAPVGSPFRLKLFRLLWLASLTANIGIWMQSVSAAWLMTSLTSSALLVALLQTAGTLPVFLVGVPTGALADILDRRWLLIWTTGWMAGISLLLGLLTLLGISDPVMLLVFTFAIGLGTAASTPIWQAIIPEIVSREDLSAAITINSASANMARAIGPAIGGLLVALVGPGAVFILTAFSFLLVVSLVWRWRREVSLANFPAERLRGAMRAGLRYVRHAPFFRAVLVRTAIFIASASALFTLLPQVARRELNLTAEGYGLLLACLGAGSVVGAFLLPRFRRRIPIDLQVVGGVLVFAFTTLALGYLRNTLLLAGMLVAGGLAWITITSNLSYSAQTILPRWVQARALAIYMLVFMGGMALGSLIWGLIAQFIGTGPGLLAAAGMQIVGLVAVPRWRLRTGENMDFSPTNHWPEPVFVLEPDPGEGPILVQVEYTIDPADAEGFSRAIQAVGLARRRAGSRQWGLFRNPAIPGCYTEVFLVDSWAEHLRQHGRVSQQDQLREAKVNAFHLGPEPPRITHLVAEVPGKLES